jgi:hypothetical protein
MLLKGLAVLGLYLAGTASSYRITAFDGNDCTGTFHDLKVWDDSCATPGYSFASFLIAAYGGKGQKVRMHTNNACSADEVIFGPYWADSGGPNFQGGNCHNFAAGHRANAAGSFAA